MIKQYLLIAYMIIASISSALSYDGRNLLYNRECVLNWIRTDENIDIPTIKRVLNFVDDDDLSTEIPTANAVRDFYKSSPFKAIYEPDGKSWRAFDQFFDVVVAIEQAEDSDPYDIKGCQLLTIRVCSALFNTCVAEAKKGEKPALQAARTEWEALIAPKVEAEEAQ